jgi:hypothetical protein
MPDFTSGITCFYHGRQLLAGGSRLKLRRGGPGKEKRVSFIKPGPTAKS